VDLPEREHRRDPGALRAGYEALREAVVCGRPEGWRLGHGVLVSKGMASWMGTWPALVSAKVAGRAAPEPSDPSAPPVPSTSPFPTALSSLRNAGEVVAVIAQMALAHA
jgi:hypothetical protein